MYFILKQSESSQSQLTSRREMGLDFCPSQFEYEKQNVNSNCDLLLCVPVWNVFYGIPRRAMRGGVREKRQPSMTTHSRLQLAKPTRHHIFPQMSSAEIFQCNTQGSKSAAFEVAGSAVGVATIATIH